MKLFTNLNIFKLCSKNSTLGSQNGPLTVAFNNWVINIILTHCYFIAAAILPSPQQCFVQDQLPPPTPGLMSNLLLQPQHEVSGIGDNGSFAQFLHRFALNVSWHLSHSLWMMWKSDLVVWFRYSLLEPKTLSIVPFKQINVKGLKEYWIVLLK